MKKYLLITLFLIILFAGFSLYQYVKFSDGKLHVIFCDVGQGDAILIRTPEGKTMLIDSGPDEKVLGCLSSHMPFWQRRINVAILTHPHADHFMGFLSVLRRYKLGLFATEKLANTTFGFTQLMTLVKQQGIVSDYLVAGDRFRSTGRVMVSVLGPSPSYLVQTSPGGTIGESQEFASLILLLSFGNTEVLLTGDSQESGLHDAVWDKVVDVLQVPHHGSKTGLDVGILEKLQPKLAVISVGKNKYGHPSGETLNLLSQMKLKVLRTDQHGDIEIISDGKWWGIR